MKGSRDFQERLERLEKRAERFTRLWESTLSATEKELSAVAAALEQQKNEAVQSLHLEEERLKGELDQAAQHFTTSKYKLEKEAQHDQADVAREEDALQKLEKHVASEVRRLHEEEVNTRISYDKQKSALNELYREKRRSLVVARERLIENQAKYSSELKKAKDKVAQELENKQSEIGVRIQTLKDQLESKKQGWSLALEAVQKEREVIKQKKIDIENKLASIKAEKEEELEKAKIALLLAKEQLEIDKVSLVEKAEQEQRECEADVERLTKQVEESEQDLQRTIIDKQKELQMAEEALLKEETMLKESVKAESDKRDYEQKLYMQEKTQKEDELKRLQEEYDKKRTHWDNQIRTLSIQKSVQDAEFDAERLRTDREVRTGLRNLEAKRDELKQRLQDLKARVQSTEVHNKKEMDLLQQRWSWRKERLWSMWQNRLEVLKKERQSLHEQMEQLIESAGTKRRDLKIDEHREEKKINELRDYSLQFHDRARGEQKQRQVQFELEKTRLINQIRECETLITDWLERQKALQQDMMQKAQATTNELGFLDRLYREEQSEAEMFMHSFQKALTVLGATLEKQGIKKEAA